MGHITDQYGPYYRPTPYPSPREGGLRLSHKTDKTYKSHKTYKPYKPLSPPWGDRGGLLLWVNIEVDLQLRVALVGHKLSLNGAQSRSHTAIFGSRFHLEHYLPYV